MYKVIFDSINSTQDEIIGFNNYKKILNNNNFYIQSFRQIKGTGRGKKKWLSPIGNIYLTINQELKASYALRNNFYINLLNEEHHHFQELYNQYFLDQH